MIFVTGDTHGEFSRLSVRQFPQGKTLCRDDYVIICGDFGYWYEDKAEQYWMNWLQEQPFTILWVDGNHENFARLDKLEVTDWHGGKVHKLSDHIMHLMRGQIYDIDGLRVFTMGGAQSHDQDVILTQKQATPELRYQLRRQRQLYRVEDETWWKEELPLEAEIQEARENLKRYDYQVDLVITHCAPESWQSQINAEYPKNHLTKFLEELYQKLEYKQWYCGHYHVDYDLSKKDHVLYKYIAMVDTDRNK